MPLDFQLTLLSTFLLMSAVACPMLFDVRRRARLGGPRPSRATPHRMTQTMAFAGPAVLTAAGMGFLVAGNLV